MVKRKDDSVLNEEALAGQIPEYVEPKVETKPEPKVTHKIPDKTKAAPTKTKSTTKSSLTAKDILSMSEEDFNKLNIDDLYS